MTTWEHRLIGFLEAFSQTPDDHPARLSAATEEWWEMVRAAGAEGWEAVNFGVDDNGNWVFMKRPTTS